MTERRKLCIRCCKTARRRLVKKYANMCVRCFGKCDIHFECRQCKSQQRRLSPQFLVLPCKDAEDLCPDCYKLAKAKDVCLRCFQKPRDRRQGSKSLCTRCRHYSSGSAGASVSSGENCRKCDVKLSSWMQPILDGLCRDCDNQLEEEQKCVSCFVAARRRGKH